MNRKLLTKLQRKHRATRTVRTTRIVARSLVLYAVLGTLALNAPVVHASGFAPAAGLHAQDAESENIRRVDAQPFRDFLAKVNALHARGELKLDGVFELTLEADRNDGGTFNNLVISGNPAPPSNVKALVAGFVQSLDGKRAGDFLEGVEHLSVRLKLDRQNASVQVVNEFASTERAGQKAQADGGMLFLARIAKHNRPEAVVLNNLHVSASGKQLVMRLRLSREALGNLLFKQITSD